MSQHCFQSLLGCACLLLLALHTTSSTAVPAAAAESFVAIAGHKFQPQGEAAEAMFAATVNNPMSAARRWAFTGMASIAALALQTFTGMTLLDAVHHVSLWVAVQCI
jgi:hypothetical protein